MRKGWLIHKDVDPLIAELVIPKDSRALNMYSILFKHYPGFVRKLFKRYNELNPLNPRQLRFASKYAYCKPLVIFDNGEKGSTRKTLYRIGQYYGYSYTTSNIWCFEGSFEAYAEDRVDFKKLYTKRELERLHVFWENDWIKIPGTNTYKFREGGRTTKRGLVKRTLKITFKKIN